MNFKRVFIVEDNIPLRNAFVKFINDSEIFRVAGAFTTCQEAIDKLETLRPDIILMDIELPGMNGVEGIKQIKKRKPEALLLVVTVFENSEIVFDALCAGASGYLTKNTSPERLISAMNELLVGGAPMSINIAKMVVQSFQRSPNTILSQRETEVLTLLSQGKSYKRIGETLFISRNTIKFHIKNIYDKLEVNNREEALKEASKKRYI